MSTSFLFQAALLTAIAVGGTIYLADNVEDPAPVELGTPTIQPSKPAPLSQGSVVSLPRTNGQFFATGRVNSGTVRFLVDTGASTVALTLEDARKAGIRVDQLNYTVTVATANGETQAARAELRDVRIGGVRVTDVEALVLREGLHISLLGMTFLGELQKVEVLPNQMILRR
ncbi:MAG: TIGR02281 family clan AA aspartic protease [Litorimonas sp.]